MAAPIRTLCCSVVRHSSRQLSTTRGVQAGEKWRLERMNQVNRTWTCVWKTFRPSSKWPSSVRAVTKVLPRHGLPRSGTEYGPLTDLPDWSFADGRPAPPLKGILRRRKEREALARRIVMLNSEMDRGKEMWKEKQEEAKRAAEQQKSLMLKPKGKLLRKKPSES